MSDASLIIGVVSALVFLLVAFVEGARRPGYNPAYHMVSALSSSADRGWVQIANFVQFGLGMVVFAIGLSQALDTVVGSVLVAIFGIGAVVSGLFSMDPALGYPPGTPPGMPTDPSMQHRIHDAAAPVMFIAIFGACLALAGRLDGGWRVYTVITAVAGLVLTVSTVVAVRRDAAKTGLIQRVLIVVYWTWIALLGVHLL
ncbi:MAG: DUF998 domain-containing protein [Acidimicrobiales bacterium]